ncbi:hypothetical protein VP01_982g7 [Puccinia sorghi]|uniref:Uncharacterized protein n=1 Tax=Puccinia sorghi TaxID=27349 RepID=A0A0L6U5N2_9BASI|nr:hypothetical protein VP01_982g7 [Puccinia sorghi]
MAWNISGILQLAKITRILKPFNLLVDQLYAIFRLLERYLAWRHSSAHHLCKEMRSHCIRWKKPTTNPKHGRIFTRHGVWYSVLLKLPYFDLTDNSVVEPMHNIILGLLRHHGTKSFGLKKNEANNHQSDPDDLNHLVQQDDISDVDSDNVNDDSDSIAMSSGEIMRCFVAFEDLSLLDSKLEMNAPCNNWGKDRFQSISSEKNSRSEAYQYVYPPTLDTVGQAKGRKLKAEEWINLFSILLIPTFLLIMKKSSSQHQDLNSKFCNSLHLVSISNHVFQNRITDEDINNLEEHLKIYWQGILRLHPQVSTKHDNHLALHLPQCVSCLGPAPSMLRVGVIEGGYEVEHLKKKVGLFRKEQCIPICGPKSSGTLTPKIVGSKFLWENPLKSPRMVVLI